MQNDSESVIEINSNQPGPTLAIFAGVHGNEKAGVYALDKLKDSLEISRGKLYFVYANPPAIEADVRMINKNLNRCFFADNTGSAPEDKRARELMVLLDGVDALLDLHMFYDDEGQPFVICEDNAIDLAKKFDVHIISTNWTKTEPGGTDAYMYLQGKIGVCVECGPISKSKEYEKYTIKTIYQFLRYFDMTLKQVDFSNTEKRIVMSEKAVFKTSEDFRLTPGLKNFMRLSVGQEIARDKRTVWRAGENECIIFPHYEARVDEEAYIIGTEI